MTSFEVVHYYFLFSSFFNCYFESCHDIENTLVNPENSKALGDIAGEKRKASKQRSIKKKNREQG